MLKKYFIIVGGIFNFVAIILVFYVFHYIYSSGLSLPIFSKKTQDNLFIEQPNLYKLTAPFLDVLASFEVESKYFLKVELAQWSGVGANSGDMSKKHYVFNHRVDEDEVFVKTVSELKLALRTANPGQTIVVAPGDYFIDSSRVAIGQGGSLSQSTHLTAEVLGSVKIYMKGEGFVVDKPYWKFSNLHLIGNCTVHSQCEHAFHVVGEGHHTLITNNILQDFNAMIKVNGVESTYPDHGKIIQNTFFNHEPRKTSNPVTPIDVMHANYWEVAENFIFDIQKSQGDKVSYAAFVKGGSSYVRFERNLVICSANLSEEYIALGLSLGGGGSSRHHRRNKSSYEHYGGIINNNVIMHCSNDVGIYVNRSKKSLIKNNILYNTLGIDVRYAESSAKINHNVISGRIKERDNAQVEQQSNLVIKRGFFTNKDGLSRYFEAPDIGDFSWKSSFAAQELTSEGGGNSSSSFDFCGVKPTVIYLGASSGQAFCVEKLNIDQSGL